MDSLRHHRKNTFLDTWKATVLYSHR